MNPSHPLPHIPLHPHHMFNNASGKNLNVGVESFSISTPPSASSSSSTALTTGVIPSVNYVGVNYLYPPQSCRAVVHSASPHSCCSSPSPCNSPKPAPAAAATAPSSSSSASPPLSSSPSTPAAVMTPSGVGSVYSTFPFRSPLVHDFVGTETPAAIQNSQQIVVFPAQKTPPSFGQAMALSAPVFASASPVASSTTTASPAANLPAITAISTSTFLTASGPQLSVVVSDSKPSHNNTINNTIPSANKNFINSSSFSPHLAKKPHTFINFQNNNNNNNNNNNHNNNDAVSSIATHSGSISSSITENSCSPSTVMSTGTTMSTTSTAMLRNQPVIFTSHSIAYPPHPHFPHQVFIHPHPTANLSSIAPPPPGTHGRNR